MKTAQLKTPKVTEHLILTENFYKYEVEMQTGTLRI